MFSVESLENKLYKENICQQHSPDPVTARGRAARVIWPSPVTSQKGTVEPWGGVEGDTGQATQGVPEQGEDDSSGRIPVPPSTGEGTFWTWGEGAEQVCLEENRWQCSGHASPS